QLTRNHARHFARTNRRYRARQLASDDLVAAAVDGAAPADETLVRAEERRRLRVAIESLPDDAREGVTLYYRERRSLAQVVCLLFALGMTEINFLPTPASKSVALVALFAAYSATFAYLLLGRMPRTLLCRRLAVEAKDDPRAARRLRLGWRIAVSVTTVGF